MMKYLQKLGKSLMLPVAALPVAAILMGIGYWIDPTGWGANNIAAAFLLKAGGAIIDNMAILFAVGVGIGMSKDGEGTSALAAVICWFMIQTLLAPASYEMYMTVITGSAVTAPAAFGKLNNQFIGIVSGLIGATCYNRFHKVQLNAALAFFSGRRCVAIVTAGAALLASIILAFIWPAVYGGLVRFGLFIFDLGPVGAGLYGFFNRMLIPVGLHHALNSVFWFDVAGINDIGKFWNSAEAAGGIVGVTGQYMTGFFPVMMFGLPGACLAMYHTAKTTRKKVTAGLMFSAAVSAFFVGITEPIEFAFMFLAPVLYAVHAGLTAISMTICAILPVRSGFNFSAGFVDWFLSFKAPMALNPWIIIPIGAAYFGIYYAIFRTLIVKLNLKTPGREDDEVVENVAVAGPSGFTQQAQIILAGIGGSANIANFEHCATRLRFEVKEISQVDEAKIKSAGVAGIVRLGKNSVQVIIGPTVQFVHDEIKALIKD